MRILFTGGGTGGHIFPLLAVATEVRKQRPDIHLVFLGPCKSHRKSFVHTNIRVHHLITGKVRRYTSLYTVLDIPKMLVGFFQAFWYMVWYMPDVVFSKGGYGAFPVVVVAWLFRIPVVAHESDSVPGLTTRALRRCVDRILVAFPGEYPSLPQEKLVCVGNPVSVVYSRQPSSFTLRLHHTRPILFFIGGSQGAQQINEMVFGALGRLLEIYEVVHQTGTTQIRAAQEHQVALPHHKRRYYHCVAFLDPYDMHYAYHQAHLVVSRAGSSAIFEIAAMRKPSILIPLARSAGHHQQQNARVYAETGATRVIDVPRATPDALYDTIQGVMTHQDVRKRMSVAARKFAFFRSAKIITRILLSYETTH